MGEENQINYSMHVEIEVTTTAVTAQRKGSANAAKIAQLPIKFRAGKKSFPPPYRYRQIQES